MKSATRKPLNDVSVLVPARIQEARAMIENALRSELGTLIDWAPTGAAPTPEAAALDTPAGFKAWASALIESLPTRPEGAITNEHR